MCHGRTGLHRAVGAFLPAPRRPYASRQGGRLDHFYKHRDGDNRVRKSTLSSAEAAITAAICFGPFVLFSLQAMQAGFPQARFSDSSNGWMVGIELVLAAGALIYLHLRGFELVSLYPEPTLKDSLLGLGLFVLCWVGGAIAMALCYTPGAVDSVEFSFDGMSAGALVALAIVNGTYEEVFLLGVLVRGLRGFGLSVAVGVPLLVRLLYHTYQGPLGLIYVGVVGLILTLAYLATRRLWPMVFAHMLLDILPVLLAQQQGR